MAGSSTCKKTGCKAGFSLLEISIVLLIIATVIGAGVATFTASLEKSQRDITIQRLAVIQQALLDYRRAFHVIPCPSNIALPVTNSNFGKGSITGASGDPCDQTYAPSWDYNPVWGGGVPVRTLKLADDYAFDGWGRRFTYFVDDTVTGGLAFNLFPVDDSAVGSLEIEDGTGVSITDKALYVVVSHGANGHGAYTRFGNARVNAGSVNNNEQKNCGCDDTAAHTGFAEFVQAPYSTDPDDITDTFDDIVVYGSRASLRLANE